MVFAGEAQHVYDGISYAQNVEMGGGGAGRHGAP